MNRSKPPLLQAFHLAVPWVSAVFLVGTLAAGEPIQFSPGRSKVEPEAAEKIQANKSKSGAAAGPSTPYDSIDMMNSFSRDAVRRRDPKEEKRLKNAALQKKNWAALEPGELQEKEDRETDFGIRNLNPDTLEKDKTAGEIWFGSKQQRGGAKDPAESRAPGGRAQGGGTKPERAPDTDVKDSDSAVSKAVGKETETPLGGLGGSDLRLNNLVRSEQQQGVALNELLGGRVPGVAAADDNKPPGREALGLRSLGQGVSGSGPMMAPGFGLGRDPGQRPSLAPAPSQIEGPGLRGSVFNSAGPSAIGGPPRSSFGSSAANSASSASGYQSPGFGAPASGFGSPQPDLSGRSVRDTFGLPARPGLGTR